MLRIVVKKQSSGWIARATTENNQSVTSSLALGSATSDEAIGVLITSHPNLFGILSINQAPNVTKDQLDHDPDHLGT